MGRNRTGAICTIDCLQIDINYLLKNGYIKRDCVIEQRLSWSELGYTTKFSLTVISDFHGSDKNIRLLYNLTDAATGETKIVDHVIFIVATSSNLGKGEIFYFHCPVTGQRCNVLYFDNESNKFISRKAFKKRLYYPIQLYSKSDKFEKANTKYWNLKDQLSELNKKRLAGYYNGKLTKRAIATEQKYKELEQAQDFTMSHLQLSHGALALVKEHNINLGCLAPIPYDNGLIY